MPARRQKLLEALQASGFSAMLVSAPENRYYLSGFSGSSGHLWIEPGRQVLVTDGRYWAQVENQCPDWELFRFRAEEHSSLLAASAAWLEGLEGKVAVESRNLTMADWQFLSDRLKSSRVQVEGTDNLVESLRLCKDAEELERLRLCARVADQALRKALEILEPGLSERDFCLELEYQMQKLGARKPAFDSIVASGPNGAFPHAGVTDRKIGRNELITLDFGAFLEHYNSDMTRTLWLGALDERQSFLYSSVREAQRRAVEAVKPGLSFRDLDAVARNYLSECGLGEYFSHSLGHGLGLAVHELPGLRSTSEGVLQEGMVVTIEPGVYIPGETGCRVEDSVVVTADGYEKLNRSPYQELSQTHPLEAGGS